MSVEGITLAALYKHFAIALFGALVHALNAHRNGRSKTIIDFISLIVMSSFAGVMFTIIALHIFPSSPYLVYAMGGTGGYLGIEGMSIIIEYFKNKIK